MPDALLALRDLVDLGHVPDSLWRAVAANLTRELLALKLIEEDEHLLLGPCRGKSRFRIHYELRSRREPSITATRCATFRTDSDFLGNIKALALVLREQRDAGSG